MVVEVVVVVVWSLSHVQLFATPWTIARPAPLPMGFPSHEYSSGLQGILPRASHSLLNFSFLLLLIRKESTD